MVRVYRAIIRSKLDYVLFFLNGTASRNSLQLLDSIHNAAIRLWTGAYRSSPVASLYADSGEMSLSLRRNQLLLQYYARTLQLPSSAMFPYVQPPQHPPMESIPKIATRIATLELNLNLNIACLPFTYQTAPLWQCSPNALCKDYSYPKKDSCSALALRSYFADHMSQFHNEQFCIYTDGSKCDDGVGCSAVSLRGSKQMKLMEESSIFTAELCGLQLANQVHRDSFVIISDSRSALQVVEHYDSTHPLIHKVIHWLHKLHRRGKTLFLLVPITCRCTRQ